METTTLTFLIIGLGTLCISAAVTIVILAAMAHNKNFSRSRGEKDFELGY